MNKNLKTTITGVSLLILWLLPFSAYSQEEASVEKSIFGVQVEFLGIWINNELKLSNTIALRSEVGFEMTNWTIGSYFYSRGNEPFIPLTLTVEPRFYFQTKQLHSLGLCIDNNVGGYLSLKIRYHAGWLMLSGKETSNLEIIPIIASRSNIGKHFNYEMGGGIGYQYNFTSNKKEKHGWAINPVFRIGYTF